MVRLGGCGRSARVRPRCPTWTLLSPYEEPQASPRSSSCTSPAAIGAASGSPPPHSWLMFFVGHGGTSAFVEQLGWHPQVEVSAFEPLELGCSRSDLKADGGRIARSGRQRVSHALGGVSR